MTDIRRRKKNKVNMLNQALFILVSSLMLVLVTLCVIIFARLNQVQNEFDLFKSLIYGVHDTEVLASEPTSVETSNAQMYTITADNSDFSEKINIDNAYNGEMGYNNTLGVDPYEGYIKVCLTFDDGPSSRTDEILDILSDYGVKATFFVNGKEGYEDEYRRIVNEGHTLGLHSYSHQYRSLYQDLDSFAEDLYTEQSFIKDITGAEVTYYRFPGGSSNRVSRMDMNECIEYLDSKDIVYYDWNVSAQDAVAGGASTTQIVNNVVAPIRYGTADTYVVLMHDAQDKVTTVEALPIIIEQLVALENVVIVPIDQNITPVQHVSVVEE